jgi:L-2-hydroxyglutarate oxidase LhgO
MYQTDCIVIGAGIIGLAVARALVLSGVETVIVEAENAIGTGGSSRNSGVIHAGIYYPKDSLKAKLCVAGRDRLYAYCETHNVPYRRCGKLLVATEKDQLDALRALAARAAANGVADLIYMGKEQAAKLEPALRCEAALLSPSTGIIDTHGLMHAYLGDAANNGATLALNSPVVRGKVTSGGFMLETGGQNPTQIACSILINAAGLQAQDIAGKIEGIDKKTIPPVYYAKGNYFTLAKASPFSRLIYPLPEPGGLGVHLTLDLAGQARFGPDVEWVDAVDYDVPAERGHKFYPSIRAYWPDLPEGALQPGYAGIRPKLVPQGKADGDFILQHSGDHNIKGLVNLYGIESPGITASLAIAETVKNFVL